MLQIKVLGPGCKNCTNLENIAKGAVTSLGIEANIEKITDYSQIMRYNILATPGLVINDQVVASGRVPSQAEVITWLADSVN